MNQVGDLMEETTTSCFKHVMFDFQMERLSRLLDIGIWS